MSREREAGNHRRKPSRPRLFPPPFEGHGGTLTPGGSQRRFISYGFNAVDGADLTDSKVKGQRSVLLMLAPVLNSRPQPEPFLKVKFS